MEEVIGLMKPETEKLLGQKLKFKKAVLEVVDDPLVRILDDKVLHPLAQKLSPEIRELVIVALEEVIQEMPETEI